jgi:hypothetical protein
MSLIPSERLTNARTRANHDRADALIEDIIESIQTELALKARLDAVQERYAPLAPTYMDLLTSLRRRLSTVRGTISTAEKNGVPLLHGPRVRSEAKTLEKLIDDLRTDIPVWEYAQIVTTGALMELYDLVGKDEFTRRMRDAYVPEPSIEMMVSSFSR